MKCVVDINYLREPKLEEYLAKSKDNYVVFTDFAGMEIYKHDALNNLACKLEIVSRYPHQVIVLKGTQEIVSLTLGPNKLPQSLIDNTQTSGFPKFCSDIKSALKGDKLLLEEILSIASSSSQYLNEDLTRNYKRIISATIGFAKSCNPLHLKALRNGKELHQDIIENLTKHIFGVTLIFLKEHLNVQAPPEFDSMKKSYVFRYFASAYLWSLRWIKYGGIEQVPEEKIRNDIVDMSYVTYATYFDGLLSLDKKLNAIYIDTINYLHLIDS
jgi:hypothetical protein